MAPAVSEWIPQSPAAARGASLSQIAYAEIKRRIITLGFKPGEFLNESTICSLLGLGRVLSALAPWKVRVVGYGVCR
jgi:hypothetical protein